MAYRSIISTKVSNIQGQGYGFKINFGLPAIEDNHHRLLYRGLGQLF